MAKAQIRINNLSGLDKAAAQFVQYLNKSKTVAFYGEMGTGKTTFIKALCAQLGVINMVNSPSFALINEYITQKKETVYHIDLYRLKTVEELLDIGYEDSIGSSNYCFIEWPEKAEKILPDKLISVRIERNNDDSRTLSIEIPGD